jgi:hypothetical protein
MTLRLDELAKPRRVAAPEVKDCAESVERECVDELERVHSSSLQRSNCDQLFAGAIDANRVSERSSKSFKRNQHHVSVFERQAVFKAKRVGTKKVNVHVARSPVLGILKMVML